MPTNKPAKVAHMNLLQFETSPYLLQHASNPVHWHPWSDEAFRKAAAEHKPILLSIGYSSCHWCHVMAHESFEDEETAQLMNELFINIKLDREEYPDIDHVYMDAVQAMTGSGGWPLNVFLMPDRKPFYGGTYFPPERAHGRASWKEVLINVSQFYSQNGDEVAAQAKKLYQHLLSLQPTIPTPSQNDYPDNITEIVHQMAQSLMLQADRLDGGFGAAPKFPSTFGLTFLLNYATRFQHQDSLDHVVLSLQKMINGGIYDQLGGGFSRYSTDKKWIAPHFEKMLYDNALLMELLSKAYAHTKHELFEQTIDHTFQWLSDEMTHEHGGFYTALDADSEGEEGKFYTWTYEEICSLIDKKWLAEFVLYYQIRKEGNWEHTNILHTHEEVKHQVSSEFLSVLPELKSKLLAIRNQRISPMRDDKILLGWNALMNKALVSVYLFTGHQKYVGAAEKNMQFLLEAMASEEHLFFHTYRQGVAKIPAFADDLAYLAQALLQLAKATGQTKYVEKAIEIVQYMTTNFTAKNGIYFSLTHRFYQQTDIQKVDTLDSALPSVNSVMADVLEDLSHWTLDSSDAQRSKQMRLLTWEMTVKYPSSLGIWANGLLKMTDSAVEVSMVGEQAAEFILDLHTKSYIPFVSYLTSRGIDDSIPAFKGKFQQGETLIFVCRQQQCLRPVTNTREAWGLISQIS